MSSRKDELPPALSAMWRLCKIGYAHEPCWSSSLWPYTLLASVPDALFALWLKLMAEHYWQATTPCCTPCSRRWRCRQR
jgi:hypothetical protein